jgi:hypothetical protein
MCFSWWCWLENIGPSGLEHLVRGFGPILAPWITPDRCDVPPGPLSPSLAEDPANDAARASGHGSAEHEIVWQRHLVAATVYRHDNRVLRLSETSQYR